MALSTGNKATYADINSVKTAINNAYYKVKGSYPTWSNFPSGVGAKITAASINELSNHGYTAAASWTNKQTVNYNSVNSNSGCTQNWSNVSTGGFGRAFRYSKCGGEGMTKWRIHGLRSQLQQAQKLQQDH